MSWLKEFIIGDHSRCKGINLSICIEVVIPDQTWKNQIKYDMRKLEINLSTDFLDIINHIFLENQRSSTRVIC